MRKPFVLQKSHKPIYVGVGIMAALIAIFILTSVILYKHTVTLLTENLRERLTTISITAAANIDAKDLETLQVESDWQKPEWARVVNKLHNAKYSNKDVVFMYIFRKTEADPSQMEFVADADSLNPYANTDGNLSNDVDVNRDGKIEPDGPDKLQWPGQPYPEASDIPEAFEAYNGPLTNKDLYTDDYGTVMTGYAPIRDENGNTVAVLGTDIKADDFFTVTGQTLYPFLLFIVFLSIVILTFDILLVRSVRKQILLGEQLQISNTGQENLIHIMNHQIKGYLSKAKSIFAELASEPEYCASDAAKPMLEEGLRSVSEGVNFVQQVLLGSSAESGKLVYNMTPVDLKPLVEAVVGEQHSLAAEKKVSLDLKTEGDNFNITGDTIQLKEAVRNLIDNSIRYAPNGSVAVNLAKNGNKALLTVKDTGVGITAEDMPKLFQKGGRGKDSLRYNVNSTGYGLAFVKGVVEAHKGRVWAESSGTGKGSAFYIELPLS